MELILRADSAVLLWIQENLRNDVITPIVKFITHLGDDGILWIALLIILMCIKKTRKAAFLTAVALLMTFITTNLILKPLVARIRPYEVIDTLTILISKPSDFSFPSGHTANSMAVGISLWLIGLQTRKKPESTLYFPNSAGWFFLILSILISISRLYLGVHYPTDVIAGALIAALMSSICFYAHNKAASPQPPLKNHP